jgi:hypothetical protein
MDAHHLKSEFAPQVITTAQLQVAGVTRQVYIKLGVEIRERENYKVVEIMVRVVH